MAPAPVSAALLPPVLLHGWLMSLGCMPLFIAGFALTTAPRWLDIVVPPAADLICLAAAASAGWAGLLLCDALRLPFGLAAACAALPAIVLGLLALRSWRWCRRPGARFSAHALGLALGLAVLALSQAGAALALALEQTLALRMAVHAGLAIGVAGVFALALQRLTPFLHQQGRRGPLLLGLLLMGLGLRAALELAGLLGWLPAPGLALLCALVFAGLAMALWRDAWRPELAPARRTPLVAQLLLGYLWLSLSFALEAGALVAAALGRAGLLGMAPLHALTLGFMATTWLAMVSRVSAVKQGRSVAADAGLWALQALLQLVAICRLAAELSAVARPALLNVAAAGFAVLALAWCGRYGPMLLGSRKPKRA